MSLEKAINRFRNNWTGYITEYRILLIVTLLAAVADMVSTCRFISGDMQSIYSFR